MRSSFSKNFPPKLIFIGILVLAVLIGIGWGLRIKTISEKRHAPEADAQILKILAVKGTLPQSLLKAFEAEQNVKITLQEETSPDGVIKRLAASREKFDLVMLLTSQAQRAISEFKIQPVKLSNLSGFNMISTDFIDLPGAAAHPSILPVLWGVTRSTDFSAQPLVVDATASKEADDEADKVASTDKPEFLWILAFALGASAENAEGAAEFLNHLLKPTVAANLSLLTGLASTNKSVETASKLSVKQKPSYLRALPMTQLRVLVERAPKEALKESSTE